MAQAPTNIVINQPESNTIGMAGFIMSLISLVTCGVLFPLGFLFSLVGVFYKPRGFAIAGLAISSCAALLLVVCWTLFIGAMFAGAGVVAIAAQQLQAAVERDDALNRIQVFYDGNDRLPTAGEFGELSPAGDVTADHLRYEIISATSAKIVHWGSDMEFGTPDDLESERDFAVGPTEKPVF